jgi:hypothetical protein
MIPQVYNIGMGLPCLPYAQKMADESNVPEIQLRTADMALVEAIVVRLEKLSSWPAR